MNPSSDPGATEFLANLSIGTIVAVAVLLTAIRMVLLRPTVPGRYGAPPEIPAFARALAEILESLIIAGVLVFLIIRPFFVQAFFIPSESMEPTLLGHNSGSNGHNDTVHDHIFVNKLIYRLGEPQRGDIIVFKAPKEADSESEGRGLPQQENVLIKRLIGIPGDTIEIKKETVTRSGVSDAESVIYRNGERLDEPVKVVDSKELNEPVGIDGAGNKQPYSIKEPMLSEQSPKAIWGVGKKLTLKPGQLFVMGDNRNDSNDSRYWGVLERNRVIGKASFIFFPLDRIRVLH